MYAPNSAVRWATLAIMTLTLGACSSSAQPEPTHSPTVTATAAARVLDDRPLGEQLIEAVRTDDLSYAALALDAGAEVDYVTGDGVTPLLLAAIRDNLDMVNALIAAGATTEFEAEGYSVLSTAGTYSGAAVIQALIDTGANPDGVAPFLGAPLSGAAYAGNVPAINALLENGATVDLGLDELQYSALVSAAIANKREAVEVLLNWGADPGWTMTDGTTAADWAESRGHRELAEYLRSLTDN